MKYLALLLFTFSALADPSVRNVQVHIHNKSKHTIELLNFDASRLFSSVEFEKERIPGNTTQWNALYFTSFDKEGMIAGVDILFDDEPMKIMWQTNMGYGGPDEPKFHLCGVIKDGSDQLNNEYCDIPYVDQEQETMYVDFRFD